MDALALEIDLAFHEKRDREKAARRCTGQQQHAQSQTDAQIRRVLFVESVDS